MSKQNAPKQKVSVFGSFGFGNVGDEAVPAAFGALMQSLGARAEIIPVSRYSSADMEGIVYTPDRGSAALKEAALHPMVLCGGGIVEPKENACLLRMAKVSEQYDRFPIRAFAISTDHSVHYPWRIRRAIKRAFEDHVEVFVRDEFSAEALSNLLPDKKIRTVGDIVLSLPAKPLPSTISLPERYFCVTLGDVWSDRAFLDWIAAEAGALAKSLEARIVLAPISQLQGKDLELHRAVAERLRSAGHPVQELFMERKAVDPGHVAALYAGSLLNISMRLHGCVISFAQRRPFVALSYHPKVQGFAETVGWGDFVLPHAPPKSQSVGHYGYAFADVSLPQGALAGMGAQAAQYDNFLAIPYFLMRQRQALARVLDLSRV
jgi:polysaccharide pyruvyl transferase WcaK-like protein